MNLTEAKMEKLYYFRNHLFSTASLKKRLYKNRRGDRILEWMPCEYHKLSSIIPFPEMTNKEVKILISKTHIKLLLANISDNRDTFQKFYDDDLNNLKKRYPGYTEALYIKNLKPELTEISLNKDSPRDQIKAERGLQLLEEQERRISESKEIQDLKLSDVLIDRILPEQIINMFNNDFLDKEQETNRGIKKQLTLFLKHLSSKGYYKKNIKLINRNYETIAKNDFKIIMTIDRHTKNIPPKKNSAAYKSSPFSKIPEALELLIPKNK